MNKLWKITLTDTLEVLSLEEQEQIFKFQTLKPTLNTPGLSHHDLSPTSAIQSQPQELAVPTSSGEDSGLLWKVLLPPISLKLVIIPLGLLHQFDLNGALLSFPSFDKQFLGTYYRASVNSALCKVMFHGSEW